ncbi:inactive tRNA-specific adenosine deaminase-like protein 3 [Pyrus ussuriensis x Pyrus communis]|uniref:Inactive tRNA-specific adenosine deaminase-like protein 3 n=1 Tax=Pyrus ussuriensis x Pyrus communis TaxID=2448454 RepID=A0A5N5I4G4_9ROSA|nr:inactive tRNA-specific adenosine deaminase-like protein 3 [Pyrus ussuriensis x Pyrus communis]
MNSYQFESLYHKSVCKYAASSKEEWEEQCKVWHNNIEGITGFSEEDSHSVFSFMKYAIQLAKSGDISVNYKQVIAKAYDQTCSCYNPKNEITLDTSCSGKRETCVCHSNTNGVLSREEHSNGFPDKSEQLYSDFALLPPFASHCIVAIESSAARDRLLFPSSLLRQALWQKDKRSTVNGDDNLDVDSEGCSRSLSARPCLCTGFDMYLVWEPCILCEMALVHQRIMWIFFACRNAKAGATGSVHGLQGRRRLNHHFAVFRVSLGTDG